MASGLPTDPRLLNNLVVTTLDDVLDVITDDFYDTNALWNKMYQRNEAGGGTIRRGGAEIKVPILYNKVDAGAFGPDDTFPTQETEDLTDLQFQWKDVFAACNLSPKKIAQNAASGGYYALFDYVDTKARNCWMTLQDLLGYQIYSTQKDPVTGLVIPKVPTGIDWDGIYNGVDNYAGTYTTYGGITRVLGPLGTPGAAINAQIINAQNAPLSLSLLAFAFGKAVFDQTKPDIGVTTQDTWNDLANRVQPQDRNAPGPLRDVGFDTILYRGMEVVPDSHVLPGDFWGLNTAYLRLYLMEGRDMVRRGKAEGFTERGFALPNQDKYVDQLICTGNLVAMGPRFHFHIKNLAIQN